MMKNVQSFAGRHLLPSPYGRNCCQFVGIVACFVLVLCLPTLRAEDTTREADSPSLELDYGQLSSQIQAAIGRAKPACVAVVQRLGRNNRSAFSAVIVTKEGHILVAGHCIRPGANYEVILDDGRALKAKALGRSPYLDCGLIKIVEEAEFPWAELGKSSELVRNQPCLSIGHPGGFVAERGLVVRFGRVVGTNSRGHIHNTCLMEPGDSGGGLFDLQGRVIGIHSYIHQSLSDNFDIPVDLFREHWEQLCNAKDFDPPYAAALFGIGLKSGRATEEGAEVTSVVQASPAAEAGLRSGDMITAVNETTVTEGYRIGRELRRLTARRRRQLNLTVRRQEDAQTIVIKRHLPKLPQVKDEPSAKYEALTKLAEGLAPVEGLLDDCTVRITSTVAGKELSVLGTVLSQDGAIVSKSSRVGESPTVIDHEQQALAAQVVARDEDNDLVLLQVDRQFEHTVDLDSSTVRVEGAILLSPRPGKADGLVSVVGSRLFSSPEQRRFGYLGVEPELRDNRVVFRSVVEGPARQAGLKSDDVVLKIGDKSITTVAELRATVGSHRPGEEVRVLIERGDAERAFDVTLGSRQEYSRRHVADAFAGGSSLRRTGFKTVFCHDAHASPDECGGPVFDAQGKFVGMNVARFSRTHCYALPVDVIRKSVARMQQPAPQRPANPDEVSGSGKK